MSISRQAKDLGLDISTVKRHRKALRDLGWIKCTHKGRAVGDPDVYVLAIPPRLVAAVPPVTPSTGGTSAPTTGGTSATLSSFLKERSIKGEADPDLTDTPSLPGGRSVAGEEETNWPGDEPGETGETYSGQEWLTLWVNDVIRVQWGEKWAGFDAKYLGPDFTWIWDYLERAAQTGSGDYQLVVTEPAELEALDLEHLDDGDAILFGMLQGHSLDRLANPPGLVAKMLRNATEAGFEAYRARGIEYFRDSCRSPCKHCKARFDASALMPSGLCRPCWDAW